MFPDLLGIIILGLIAVLFVYQLIISIQYLQFFRFNKKNNEVSTANFPVSVLICARNEAQNLQKNIPLIAQQKYPHFEILVVNDRSWDETKEILEELQKTYSNLRFIEVPDSDMYFQGKKFAQTLGIKAAKHEHLVFTDADCIPNSDQWLAAMVAPLAQGKEISLGYGAYIKRNTFLNLITRFETLNTGAHYLSRAYLKRAYMGVGRNLAYTKSLFFKHKGFYKHMHLPSGDDDLFVNEAATPNNSGTVFSKNSLTLSEAKNKWSEWFFQKRRHYSSSSFYTSSSKIYLAFNSFSRSGLYVLTLLFILLYPSLYYWPLGFLFLYILIRTIALSQFAKNTLDRDVAHLFLFLDLPAMILQYAVIGINLIVGKPKVWRKR